MNTLEIARALRITVKEVDASIANLRAKGVKPTSKSRDTIKVTVKVVNGERWGDLSAIASAHDICGETVRCSDQNFPFAGQHRVRLYHFKKNVHWRIPIGVELDISGVQPEAAPRRQPRRP